MGTIRKGYVDARSGQVHYRRSGPWPTEALSSSALPPNGLPIVLLHQSPSSSAMFEALMRARPERTFVAPDTPGFGGSDPLDGPATVEAWAGAIEDALDAVGVTRCFLFGHHTGASIAAQLAHDRPTLVERLWLSGPPLLTEGQREKLRTAVGDVSPDEEGRFLARLWSMLRQKEPDVPLALSRRELALALQARDAYPAAYRAVADHDFARLLPAIRCPVLLTAGPHDALAASVAPTRAALPDARSATIPDAGTYVCERQLTDVASHLDAFF